MTAHERALERLLRGLPKRHASEWLYEHYFIAAKQRVATQPSGDAAFVAELVAAGEGAHFWKPDFIASRRIGPGGYADGPIRLWIADRRRGQRPSNARLGAKVSVLMPCVREAPLSGFVGLTSRGGSHPDDEPHLKLYVNAMPAGSLALFRALTHEPALRRLRFDAKTLNAPRLFGRRDTLLLYARVRDTPALVKWLRVFMRERAELFRDEVPPLTQKLARGLGLAESPFNTPESFGAQRCRLIAEGLVTARRERRAWNACVAERFEREGHDWKRPWVGLASHRVR